MGQLSPARLPEPRAGACASDRTATTVVAAGPGVIIMGGPGPSPSTAVIIRPGPDASSVTSHVSEGRSARAFLVNPIGILGRATVASSRSRLHAEGILDFRDDGGVTIVVRHSPGVIRVIAVKEKPHRPG